MTHRRAASLRLPKKSNDEAHLALSTALSQKQFVGTPGRNPASEPSQNPSSEPSSQKPASEHSSNSVVRTFSQEELEKIGHLGLAFAMSSVVCLTPSQCSLLRFSWQHVGKNGPSGIGKMIFRRIFKKEPKTRKMFSFGELTVPEMAYDKDFDRHANNFIGVIDGAVKNLDSLGNFAPQLIRHGMHHANLKQLGFKPEWWDVFAEAMTESAIEWTGPGRGHRDTVKAWTILMSYIVDKMRFGYDMEIKSMRRKANGFLSAAVSPVSRGRASSNVSNCGKPQQAENQGVQSVD